LRRLERPSPSVCVVAYGTWTLARTGRTSALSHNVILSAMTPTIFNAKEVCAQRQF
jgi:hypothetical protein